MNLRIIYFNTPFWRAEVARLALFIGDVPFDDVRINKDEFVVIKRTGAMNDGTKIPFKQLPALVVDGRGICQTGAIARFCGKLSNLYSNDSFECAQIDQIIDLATDMNVLVRPSMIEEDIMKKKALRQVLSDSILPNKIQLLENLLEQKENKEFCVGEKFTIADLAIWRIMGWFSTGVIDDISEDILKPFPLVLNVCKNVEMHSKVVDWVSKTYPKTYKWLR
jgi:glutathione S-transferase